MSKIPDSFYVHSQNAPAKIAYCRIYDNGGKTFDRYTAVFMDRLHDGRTKELFEALGFSADPFHPLGFGQHTSAAPGRHLGKRVRFEELNADCQQFIRQNV